MAIVLLSGDLAVLSRVEGAAAHLGQAVRSASSESQVVEFCKSNDANPLIVDLSTLSCNLADLVSQLKPNESSGTRIVAFGPHVHEQRLAAAREAGCDLVVSRGQFFSQLETILKGQA
jgi:DNA-binding NarL/FixJ family response regulator